MQHTAEVHVEKRVTLTLSGAEFDTLLGLAAYGERAAHSPDMMRGYDSFLSRDEISVMGRRITRQDATRMIRSLRDVECDLRKRFNVYAEGRVHAV